MTLYLSFKFDAVGFLLPLYFYQFYYSQSLMLQFVATDGLRTFLSHIIINPNKQN